jgi:drug/metabolite transporter (DMT)-like permease
MTDFAFVIVYVLATAYSAVFLNVRLSDAPAHLVAFATFSISWLFFLAVNRGQVARLAAVWGTAKKELLVINISTAFSWLGMFWCLKFVSASVQTLVYTATLPVASVLLARQWRTMPVSGRVAVSAILGSGLLIACTNPSLLASALSTQLSGIALALGAGTCGAVYMVWSGALQQKQKLSSNDMLCLRLPVLLLLSGLLSLGDLPRLVDTVFLGKALLLAVLLVVLPSYLLQQSILKIGSVRTSVLLPLVPAVAMLLETREGFAFSPLALLLLTLLCGAMMFVSWLLIRLRAQAAAAQAAAAAPATAAAAPVRSGT